MVRARRVTKRELSTKRFTTPRVTYLCDASRNDIRNHIARLQHGKHELTDFPYARLTTIVQR